MAAVRDPYSQVPLRLVRYVCSTTLCLSMTLGSARGVAQSIAAPPEAGSASTAGGAPLTSASPAEYQRVMSLGLDEFRHGHWAEARALFLRGHALSPNARSFRALGMTAFNLRRYPEALRELTSALNDPRRPLTKALSESTRTLQDEADTFVGRYRLQREPATATLRIDGLETQPEPSGELLLAVGGHWLELDAPGYATLTRPLLVDGTDGETLRLTLVPLTVASPKQVAAIASSELASDSPSARASLPRTPPSAPRGAAQLFRDYRWTFILGAGTLGFGAGAIALQVQAQHEDQRVADECASRDDCSPTADLTLKRDQLQASSIALWVTSGLLAVTTLVMVLVEKRRVNEREAIKALAP